MRQLVVFVLLAIAAPLCVQAQSDSVTDPLKGTSLAFGLHFGSPLRYSAAAGVMIDMSAHRNDGAIVMFEPGYQGNEISAGYFRQLGRFGSGYSLRAAVVRTKDDPWNASPSTTYVGAEAHWMLIFGIGGRLGYLRRASAAPDHLHDNLASVGVSIGF
jgi:hypothetical protein